MEFPNEVAAALHQAQASAAQEPSDSPLATVLETIDTNAALESSAGDAGPTPEDPAQSEAIEMVPFNTKRGVKFNLQLYSAECLNCGEINPAIEESYSCSAADGNRHCPGTVFQIEFVGKRLYYEQKIDEIRAYPAGIERTNLTFAIIDKLRKLKDDNLRTHLLGYLGV
jgi:hypothetical protein